MGRPNGASRTASSPGEVFPASDFHIRAWGGGVDPCTAAAVARARACGWHAFPHTCSQGPDEAVGLGGHQPHAELKFQNVVDFDGFRQGSCDRGNSSEIGGFKYLVAARNVEKIKVEHPPNVTG